MISVSGTSFVSPVLMKSSDANMMVSEQIAQSIGMRATRIGASSKAMMVPPVHPPSHFNLVLIVCFMLFDIYLNIFGTMFCFN